ncbi:DUF2989 domain-containing protein [Photobacterium nomapromontoriensis]|uniref:DUF2989 domain-containing protein n=1 Tax=Photobacterium nomapromontoriensis TaxID=2910237 RepID=UPI003D0EAB16
MTRVLRTTIQYTALLTSILLLSGCFERHRSTDSLCEGYPQLCADTNLNDGQCRLQRASLIWQRYDVYKNPSDSEKFQELKFTYDYQKCLEYAARIEPTEFKERKTNRSRALINAYDSIKRLNTELAHSTDPDILYFRWSQGERAALRQFLRLEGSPSLETPDLQFGLASYYTAKDQEKTIRLLKHALELYQPNQVIKPEIIQSLATLSHQQGHTNTAYLWAKIGKELSIPVTSQAKLSTFYPMTTQQRETLDLKAEKIAEAIRDGQFNANMVQ